MTVAANRTDDTAMSIITHLQFVGSRSYLRASFKSR